MTFSPYEGQANSPEFAIMPVFREFFAAAATDSGGSLQNLA